MLRGNHSLDPDLAAAARRTIVTAERIATTVEMEEHEADVLGGWVDHVVAAPGGARPASCHPEYDVDFAFLADYVEACRDGDFDAFLERRVL